ncbi:MAG: phosphotransferase [Gemmataceae bacterium]|nr:phosphotransferase [Gemmataceae bacterium]
MSLDLAAATVLREYPALFAGELLPLGNRGGFSSARLWRVGSPGGAWCLRAWPESGPFPERLQAIHRLMEAPRAEGLTFVPAVLRTNSGRTWVEHAGRLWELTTWMPGRADFHDCPTPARLDSACTALARLHLAWAKVNRPPGPCPAVQRRLQGARAWAELLASGWRPPFAGDDPVRPWAERAWNLLPPLLAALPKRLAPWIDLALPLHPCLCDVWHDHVLFEGDSVSGLIDYGSVKVDHVAVDLARLLGSLVPDDGERTARGLEAYARVRPLSDQDVALVSALDETGTMLAVVSWLRWLYHEGRRYEDLTTVAGRLKGLVGRLERLRGPILASGACERPGTGERGV